MLCTISVVVHVDAELDIYPDDERQTECGIVSQWREVSADEQRQLRDRFDEIVRPLGFETSMVVIRPVDERQTECGIVSQWREVSANEQHQLRDWFNEILRPFGFETSLVVIRRAN